MLFIYLFSWENDSTSLLSSNQLSFVGFFGYKLSFFYTFRKSVWIQFDPFIVEAIPIGHPINWGTANGIWCRVCQVVATNLSCNRKKKTKKTCSHFLKKTSDDVVAKVTDNQKYVSTARPFFWFVTIHKPNCNKALKRIPTWSKYDW